MEAAVLAVISAVNTQELLQILQVLLIEVEAHPLGADSRA